MTGDLSLWAARSNLNCSYTRGKYPLMETEGKIQLSKQFNGGSLLLIVHFNLNNQVQTQRNLFTPTQNRAFDKTRVFCSEKVKKHLRCFQLIQVQSLKSVGIFYSFHSTGSAGLLFLFEQIAARSVKYTKLGFFDAL